MYDIWFYGIIPAFFIFSILAFKNAPPDQVSVFKLIAASLFWPVATSLVICFFIAEWIKAITNDSGNY